MRFVTPKGTEVQVGQVWESCDPREPEVRRLRVLGLFNDGFDEYARMENVTSGRKSKVRIVNLVERRKGYRLVQLAGEQQ